MYDDLPVGYRHLASSWIEESQAPSDTTGKVGSMLKPLSPYDGRANVPDSKKEILECWSRGR